MATQFIIDAEKLTLSTDLTESDFIQFIENIFIIVASNGTKPNDCVFNLRAGEQNDDKAITAILPNGETRNIASLIQRGVVSIFVSTDTLELFVGFASGDMATIKLTQSMIGQLSED